MAFLLNRKWYAQIDHGWFTEYFYGLCEFYSPGFDTEQEAIDWSTAEIQKVIDNPPPGTTRLPRFFITGYLGVHDENTPPVFQ
jgi:hypothetical protein